MNIADIVIICILAAAVAAATVFIVRRRKKGKCIGCSGIVPLAPHRQTTKTLI